MKYIVLITIWSTIINKSDIKDIHNDNDYGNVEHENYITLLHVHYYFNNYTTITINYNINNCCFF